MVRNSHEAATASQPDFRRGAGNGFAYALLVAARHGTPLALEPLRMMACSLVAERTADYSETGVRFLSRPTTRPSGERSKMDGQKRALWKVLHTQGPINLWLVVSEEDGWVKVLEDYQEEAAALRRAAELAGSALNN